MHGPVGEPRFTDLFSEGARCYAAARPQYPDELFAWLAALLPDRSLVWDCATGNGQAAGSLSRHFRQVIATDASLEQIRYASPRPNVSYVVSLAEASGLRDHVAQLVTVAQALHWLDHDGFYREVRRVAALGGLIAAWSYGACSAGPDVDTPLRQFEHGTLGPYWNAARRWVDEGYRTIPFPFAEIPMPAFELRVRWSLSQLGEYLRSWSAVARYRRDRAEDPVAPLLEHIVKHWGSSERTREIVWPLALRVGRVG